MNELPYFLDILKFSISGLIIFFVAWFFIRSYLEEKNSYKVLEMKKAIHEQILPLRLQAYERLILFIERINPANMLLRLHVSGMSALEMQNIVLSDIRAEYQHNITQQIYVSNTAWIILKKMKEETLDMINGAVRGLPQNASAVDLSKAILTHLANLESDNPYDAALDMVKKDIQQMF